MSDLRGLNPLADFEEEVRSTTYRALVRWDRRLKDVGVSWESPTLRRWEAGTQGGYGSEVCVNLLVEGQIDDVLEFFVVEDGEIAVMLPEIEGWLDEALGDVVSRGADRRLLSEEALARFFRGEISASAFAESLPEVRIEPGAAVRYSIVDAEGSFILAPAHLLLLCDAVIRGDLDPRHLRTIGFCILASDFFLLPADKTQAGLVGGIANDWATPEINFPLNERSVRRWRTILRRGDASGQ